MKSTQESSNNHTIEAAVGRWSTKKVLLQKL